MIYAGIELGGTKCEAILAHDANHVLARETIPTTLPEETLGRIESRLLDWRGSRVFGALGIASFGPIDVDPSSASYGQMLATPKPGWAGADVARRLEKAIGVATAFDTDVN